MRKIHWLGAAAAISLVTVAACDVTNTQTQNRSEADAAPPGAVEKLARIDMKPDTSFLTAEEREVVNLLIQAADLMSEIYKRQATPDYDRLRAEVAAKNDPALLD